jgi:hypothetical protein
MDENITTGTLEEIAERIARGEIDKSVMESSMKGVAFTNFIVSYATLHDIEISTILTGTINVPVYLASQFLETGNFKEAFSIIDSAILLLQSGKAELTRTFNEQTDDEKVIFKKK